MYGAWVRPWDSDLNVRDEKNRLGIGATQIAQPGPTGISRRSTDACSRIAIGTTGRAEALTILPTECKRRNGQKPFLTHCRTDIQLSRPSGDWKHVLFVCVVETRLREQHMDSFRYSDGHLGQAAPARRERRSFQPAAQIKTTVTCSRESASDVHAGTRWARVVCLPHRIRCVST